jgi:teichuronic acid biosynthesis glycosyltransferase TuaC
MIVLFVSSGNSHYGIVPFIKSQGESLRQEGVDVEYFTVKGKGIKGYIRNITPLRTYIKQTKFDIIHAHYGLIGLLCVLAFPGIPIVLSVMGSDAYGSFNDKGKRIKSSYFDMLLTQIALIFVNQIIVKSKNILKIIPYKNKSQIIPNGVDFEIFKPDNKSLKQNTVLFLANPVDPRKNFRLVKEAIELIDDKYITLFNPYPIKHNEFPKFLNNSSVFVLTSYNEGSPNVIKEAMACNVSIVSTDVGDVKDVIGNTEGCFITTFDPKDVAEKIKQAIEYGNRTTGRNDIQHLESGVIAKKIINLYRKVIK